MKRKEYLELGIEICKFLVDKYPITTQDKHYEGRRNAEKTEKEWGKKLPQTFEFRGKTASIIKPEKDDRFWTDFAIIYDGEFFPLNFKSGLGGTKDNISGLKYIRYLIFYDLDGEYNLKSITEENLAKEIVKLKKKEKRFNENNRDYFCLAHNSETKEIKIIPVACLKQEDLTTNPKNLFQADFHNAKFDINRSLKDSVDFIIHNFINYNKKRAKSYLIFKMAGLVD